MRRFLLVVTGTLCLGFVVAQELSSTTTVLSLDESLARSILVPLPTLAFLDDSCRGQAVDFLSERQVSTLRGLYESASDDVRVFLTFSPWCLTIVDVTRAEAHAIIAEIAHQMRTMEILSLAQGYFGRSYAGVGVVSFPDVFMTSFMVAEEHGAEFTVNPYHFGYVVFEYNPDRRWLRLHSHRYTYAPGE